ncbi:hypothetical protein, partial [Klebsiella pneumoniae]|uniref:hypothetical protein n=1 Tax=Klebsiella pneumoniae TaxID=573 RepID=UPI00358F6367
NDEEHVFIQPVGHLSIFLGEMCVSIFCPGFVGLIVFFPVEMYEFTGSYGCSPLLRCLFCKHPVAVVVLSLH